MNLTGICLITEDVRNLVSFYERVLLVKFNGDDVHAEVSWGGRSFVIYSRKAANDQMSFNLEKVYGTGNVVLMFQVPDVDKEFERVSSFGEKLITKPIVYPWGAKSFHFYDPDGNIVDFVTPPNFSSVDDSEGGECYF